MGGLALFCGVFVGWEKIARGLVGVGGMVGHVEEVVWSCGVGIFWEDVGVQFF